MILEPLMWGIAAFELLLGAYQIHLTRKLKAQADHTEGELLKELGKKATKQEVQQVQRELQAKATKQEVDGLRQAIPQTVQGRVPQVLREMADQYVSQRPAGQQGSSGVDSR